MKSPRGTCQVRNVAKKENQKFSEFSFAALTSFALKSNRVSNSAYLALLNTKESLTVTTGPSSGHSES